jgi:hypothetical protein
LRASGRVGRLTRTAASPRPALLSGCSRTVVRRRGRVEPGRPSPDRHRRRRRVRRAHRVPDGADRLLRTRFAGGGTSCTTTAQGIQVWLADPGASGGYRTGRIRWRLLFQVVADGAPGRLAQLTRALRDHDPAAVG